MARRPFVVGNWKMNLGPGEADTLAIALKRALWDRQAVDVSVAPPYLSIPEVVNRLRATGIGVAAQNCHGQPAGAFTGEVSAPMVRAAGCTQVLIGHSERRQYFGETDESVNLKIRAALDADLEPIVCVGEALFVREAGKAVAVVEQQLEGALSGLGSEALERCTLAYEPVWAIGTGRTASPEQAEDMHRAIRTWLSGRFPKAAVGALRILYGGSVTPANAALLLAQPDIDGALVGGASLKIETFLPIVEAATTRS
ncbi:MAG: triose-phosphate isomerase [Deltaproteobacteria bacterium]|nr:triose-phosphate isomerase [Deltaproteobacteria bacterium]